jgi:hypothetical protein
MRHAPLMNLPERLAFLAERLEAIAEEIGRAAKAQDTDRVRDLLDELERVRVELQATMPPR